MEFNSLPTFIKPKKSFLDFSLLQGKLKIIYLISNDFSNLF